eukprot:12983045-Heterocapsa_arctica.AAC.1
MLRALVKPQFSEDNFTEEWMIWEKAVQEYEEASGQKMDDSMQVAALIDGATVGATVLAHRALPHH